MDEDVDDFIGRQKEGSRIWLVGSAELVGDFIRETQVDEMILSIIPVILGNRIRLFHSGSPEIPVKLTNGQIAQPHYQREK
ncbi:dihydrofolate reductase family protein [Peribacillus sp. NPDC101480]|uniref:dihydrofolate reductase family protein n=2 Tax=unclassified Peribacillus TaxID=2675266 RepID=UPI003CFE835A